MLTEHTRHRRLVRGLRYAHLFLGGVLVVIMGVVAIQTWVLTWVRVDGHSMDTTLHDGQIITVLRTGPWNSRFSVGQIVVLKSEQDENQMFIKRIVAVPGQQVKYKEDIITLNERQLFVEGDNREASTDSRVYGPVYISNVIGTAVGVFAEAPTQ